MEPVRVELAWCRADGRERGRVLRRFHVLFHGTRPLDRPPNLFKAMSAAPPNVKLFGADHLAKSVFTEKRGPGQQFFADFRANFGRDPEPYAIYGYEAMSVVLDAIANAEGAGTDAEGRQAVVDAFVAIEGRSSVLGTYGIDEFGDTTLPDYGGFRVEGGEVVFDRVINTAP